MAAPELDPATRTELEAAAFRRLVEHLRERTDVQNIDLMNLAGFCRNCLSRWYREEAAEKGIDDRRSGRARDRLRHALQGVAGEVPEGGDSRAESGVCQGESGRLTVFPRLAPGETPPFALTLARRSGRVFAALPR